MLREKRTFWRKLLSLPSWERGLKFAETQDHLILEGVAPLVGAWIEIYALMYEMKSGEVAPLVGAWIEILKGVDYYPECESLPSWERGLK